MKAKKTATKAAKAKGTSARNAAKPAKATKAAKAKGASSAKAVTPAKGKAAKAAKPAKAPTSTSAAKGGKPAKAPTSTSAAKAAKPAKAPTSTSAAKAAKPAKAAVAPEAPRATDERCDAFGYKCAWLAVPDRVPGELASSLLDMAIPTSWKDGVDAAYKGAIFVTPAVEGWTFVVSTQFFEHAEDPSDLLERVGPGAQFFASDRVIDLNVAMKNGGELTKLGNEDDVMELAGQWGFNPQELSNHPTRGEQGYLGATLAYG